MCGICGVASFNGASAPHVEQIHQMCATIYHRGPDDEGLEVKDSVGLGMRRLAIIDLSGGNQPIYNEDRTIRIVFNGEIYNFRELKNDLLSRGHRFYTKSDTEVIVHAYESYGDHFPGCLNGMFSFAIHDENRKRLLLARDHLGVKPLFYHIDNRHLIWGSEIKAILASKLVEPQLDLDALVQFLTWEYIPGADTLFSSIRKLKPGHLLDLDLENGQHYIQEYWDIPDPPLQPIRSDSEWIDLVDAKIRECVKRQLVSDVPLGAFLSGGVDSSLVVNAMEKAETFSIGFDDPSYNELEWARKVAIHLGVNHKDDIINPDIFEMFDHLMHFMDDPIGDFSIFPTFLVSKHARKNVTVSLSGDGGDELFGGYETYVADQRATQYQLIPKLLRQRALEPLIHRMKPRPQKKGIVNKAIRFIEGMEHSEKLGHARWRLFLSNIVCQSLLSDQVIEAISSSALQHIFDLYEKAISRSPVNRNLYVDVKSYLVDNCLVKMDRMSMAVSLEARVPLLDKELAEIAFQVPDHLKVKNGKTKILLKQIAAKYVPKECVYRPKEGFSIPIKNWLVTDLRPLMMDLLSAESLQAHGLFRTEMINQLIQNHLNGTSNNSHILWSLMVFQAWYRRWLKDWTRG